MVMWSPLFSFKCLAQQADHLLGYCQVQRCLPIIVFDVQFRSEFNKHLCGPEGIMVGCVMERCIAQLARGIDIGAMFDEQPGYLDIAANSSKGQDWGPVRWTAK